MGTISDKLMRIINTKEDIRQALISKGYDVPTSIPFKEYAKMISDLPCRVDSFPDIEGIVARYSALGLTNEQMAANPVWVDKTGNGHDLQMKNFAWKEGSGISDIYPGALVFDGVDDYGACDNFPVLTKEKGYTVVSLRKYITPDPKSYLISNGDTARLAAFLVEGNFPTIQYWNFGAVGNLNYIDNLPYVYQTSKEYNGRSINKGDLNEGVTSLLVCKYGSWHSNAAIWEIVILDHDATEEELTKIKDYFVKTYPWLFFDQAWTVTGKTNEDEDRATIANITGNDNDLVLSNFGFIEGSGYNEEGEYAGYLVTDGMDDMASSNTIIYEADFTFIGEWKFIQKDDTVAGINSSSHLYIQNRYNRGATVMINSTFENKKNITDYMTFKAITSKGKAYDENWNEVDLLYGDGNKGPSGVNIGGQGGTEFCHMIFKNMALYMNKVFSKDDCIKAYNYLQTLKAK